jgi:hypothetical protein
MLYPAELRALNVFKGLWVTEPVSCRRTPWKTSGRKISGPPRLSDLGGEGYWRISPWSKHRDRAFFAASAWQHYREKDLAGTTARSRRNPDAWHGARPNRQNGVSLATPQNPLNGDGNESNSFSRSRFGTGPSPFRSPIYIVVSAASLNDGQRGRPGALGLPL